MMEAPIAQDSRILIEIHKIAWDVFAQIINTYLRTAISANRKNVLKMNSLRLMARIVAGVEKTNTWRKKGLVKNVR